MGGDSSDPRTVAEVEARIAALAAEREPLELRCRALAEEHAALVHEADRADDEARKLAAEVDALGHRIQQAEEEAEVQRQEIPLLERQVAENGAHLERLDRQIAELEAEILASQGGISATRSALQLLQDSVARMDHKLAGALAAAPGAIAAASPFSGDELLDPLFLRGEQRDEEIG